MKIDPDLVRDILLDVVADPARAPGIGEMRWLTVTIDGKSPEEISEHVRLLGEAGFMETLKIPKPDGYYWFPVRLTWEGQQYLAGVENATMYTKVKEVALRAFGTVTLETVKAAIPYVLRELAKQAGLGG